MKMYFFRGDVPNFGDELNEWLLPKVFPDFFDQDDSTLFLGIGSVLFDTHPKHARKIVFGSGYAGYTSLPDFDDNWRIYCVRGPRTADACRLDRAKVAGDAAILINKFRPREQVKSIRRSFMPHWESVERGHWRAACGLAGVHFIDPRSPVEDVLRDIEASETVITEAMHGAIVADALRVPWVPILPFHRSHWMKWYDWAEALGITLNHHRLFPSSLLEAWVSGARREGRTIRYASGIKGAAIRAVDHVFVVAAAAALTRAASTEPTLSGDAALARARERLEESAHAISADFASSRA